MNISELVSKIDTSKEDWVDVDILAEWFRLDNMYLEPTIELKITKHPIVTRYCTDTIIGVYAYFLDGIFAGISTQTGRKSDKNFQWLPEMYKPVKEHLLKYLGDSQESEDFLDVEEDISKLISSFREIQFKDSTRGQMVEYQGKEHEVDHTWKDPESKFLSSRLMLKGLGIVEASECLLPVNLKEGETL